MGEPGLLIAVESPESQLVWRCRNHLHKGIWFPCLCVLDYKIPDCSHSAHSAIPKEVYKVKLVVFICFPEVVKKKKKARSRILIVSPLSSKQKSTGTPGLCVVLTCDKVPIIKEPGGEMQILDYVNIQTDPGYISERKTFPWPF